MATTLFSIRPARLDDCIELAQAHEEAWRHAYQGVIPHLSLERMIARRGPRWWQRAIERRSPVLILDHDGVAAGYVTYGRARSRSGAYEAEIYELYVRPVYQGLGFGRRLFKTARASLAQHRLKGLVIWALADNESACRFYARLGGKPVSEGMERFEEKSLRKIAYAWR